MKFTKLLASAVMVVSLTACEDVFEDGSLQPDGSKPALTIRNPSNNQKLSVSSGLRVKLTASDKDKVKELQVRVRAVGGDADYINFTTLPDKKILEFDTLLNANDMPQGDYTLTINATDFRTNVATNEVIFSVK
ncbi:Ig-like domain-containing protein [Pontibacter virosus]|uniref:DUF4625 domain-containing protein n=1 Tax=Pontibacter virosus TaxID=1765052 RepID=A0A2U1AXT1_9BACT|nr:Ig-like domain-containing protein [Pontibacter virosus]PVY41254.1 hypothetical protein C8E01_105183 [Pontibacter virosus]